MLSPAPLRRCVNQKRGLSNRPSPAYILSSFGWEGSSGIVSWEGHARESARMKLLPEFVKSFSRHIYAWLLTIKDRNSELLLLGSKIAIVDRIRIKNFRKTMFCRIG